MAPTLYLDTARLGKMSPQAKAANIAFTTLAGDLGCSVRFEDLLYHGFHSWDASLQRRYSGLSDWQGISGLKESLRVLTGSQPELPVLLASRTAELMRLSARLLFRKCKRVLLSDLEWPAYRAILENEARRTGGEAKQVPLRELILNDQASLGETVSFITGYYHQQRCDGIFLSSVTYQGILLPVRQVAQALASAPRAPFVVVDGAQGFCHAPTELELEYCDFFLAGCHKWLRAYHPMGLGFCGRKSSQSFVKSVCQEMMDAGELGDPLLQFTSWMEEGIKKRFTETVSLGPLFSCVAAATEVLGRTTTGRDRLSDLLTTARELEEISLGTGWTPMVAHDQLRSGILLLRNEARRGLKTARPEEVRERFQKFGVALTAYENGIIRLSAPPDRWQEEDGELLRFALDETAPCSRAAWH